MQDFGQEAVYNCRHNSVKEPWEDGHPSHRMHIRWVAPTLQETSAGRSLYYVDLEPVAWEATGLTELAIGGNARSSEAVEHLHSCHWAEEGHWDSDLRHTDSYCIEEPETAASVAEPSHSHYNMETIEAALVERNPPFAEQ